MPLQFKLLVRSQCHTLGAPVFEEVARSNLLWPRLNDGNAESWDLPIPRLLAVPEELEATSGRWRSRAALLAWPKGVQVCEDPPFELQACPWRGGDASGDAALDVIDPNGWVCVSWSLIQLHGLPCIAASQLPFSCCRFRWYSCDRRVAGPHSEACLTFIDSPVEVTSEVFCTISAVKVKASFEMPSISSSIPFCQWRIGSLKACRTDGLTSDVEEWHVLDLQSVASCSRSKRESLSCFFGEEDGLELGSCYVFSVRIGDGRRSSVWSVQSAPVVFGPEQREEKSCRAQSLLLIIYLLCNDSINDSTERTLHKMVLSGENGYNIMSYKSGVCVGGCHLGFDASKRPRFDIPDADSPTPSGVGPHKPLGNRCCTVSAINSTIHDVDVLHATKHFLSASQLFDS